MKHIIILINLFLIALIVAPATAQADTLSDKSEKLVSILSPFIGDFEGDHEEMKLNAHFNARWNQTKTAMFFTWTSNLKESKKKVIQIYGVGVLDKDEKVVWHLHGSDGSKIDMKLVKHKKGKYEFQMSGSTPSGTLYEEVYWELMDNGDFDHVITKKVVGGIPQKAFGFILKKKLNKKR